MLAKTDALRQKQLTPRTNQVEPTSSKEMSHRSVNMLISLALLLAISLSVEAIVRPLPPFVGIPTHDGLTRLFLNSQVTRRNPQMSVSCFAGYIGDTNLIAEQYSGEYGVCQSDVEKSRLGIDKDFLATRKRIEKSAESVCGALNYCSKVDNTLDSFNCHAAAGSNNTVSTYSITGNASEAASVLQERYRLINLHHNQCLRKAERGYVEATAGNYNYLQSCLEGRVKPKPLPTTTSSTTTTTTTTTTTEAPTTTTTETPTTESQANLEDQFKQLLNLLN